MPEHDATFADRFAEILARSGWPRMSARIFASLMSTPSGALTAAELSGRLDVGASAISNGAKMLRALDLVDVTRRADRQIAYRVRPDAWMEAVAHQDERLRMLEDVLNEGARTLQDAPTAQRLLETADFFAFLRAELPVLAERWKLGRTAADEQQ